MTDPSLLNTIYSLTSLPILHLRIDLSPFIVGMNWNICRLAFQTNGKIRGFRMGKGQLCIICLLHAVDIWSLYQTIPSITDDKYKNV